MAVRPSGAVPVISTDVRSSCASAICDAMARFQIELVELQLVALEHALERLRRAPEVGGPDRLVRFLGVAHLGLVLARALVVVVAVHLAHGLAGLAERLVAERRRVGAVVRDQALEVAAADVDALEQPLRDLHRALGREAELAVGFLLQRRGRERRRRPLRERLLVDAGDRPRHVARQRRRPGPRAAASSSARDGARRSAGRAASKSLPVATRSSPTRPAWRVNSRPSALFSVASRSQ